MLPWKNKILASSPPSSIAQSVSGYSLLTPVALANTSCTKGSSPCPHSPNAPDPLIANLNGSFVYFFNSSIFSKAFWRTCALCLS